MFCWYLLFEEHIEKALSYFKDLKVNLDLSDKTCWEKSHLAYFWWINLSQPAFSAL